MYSTEEQEFLEPHNKKKKKTSNTMGKVKCKTVMDPEILKQSQALEEKTSKLEAGRVPKEILGVTDVGGVLRFLMKWEELENATFVLAKEANEAYPQLVIDFYESKLKFDDGQNKRKKRSI